MKTTLAKAFVHLILQFWPKTNPNASEVRYKTKLARGSNRGSHRETGPRLFSTDQRRAVAGSIVNRASLAVEYFVSWLREKARKRRQLSLKRLRKRLLGRRREVRIQRFAKWRKVWILWTKSIVTEVTHYVAKALPPFTKIPEWSNVPFTFV